MHLMNYNLILCNNAGIFFVTSVFESGICPTERVIISTTQDKEGSIFCSTASLCSFRVMFGTLTL